MFELVETLVPDQGTVTGPALNQQAFIGSGGRREGIVTGLMVWCGQRGGGGRVVGRGIATQRVIMPRPVLYTHVPATISSVGRYGRYGTGTIFSYLHLISKSEIRNQKSVF